MKTLLLTVLFISTRMATQAQGTGEIYAAPGMAVRVPSRINPAPAKSRPTVVVRGTATVVSTKLPRFWHQTDTARNHSAWLLHQFARPHINNPFNTLLAGIEGIIYVRLTVMADGSVRRTEIIRRNLTEEGGNASYSESGRGALDAEVLRVTQALRFSPSSARADTVTISHRFVMQ